MEGQCIAPCHFIHIREVTLVQHRAGTHAEVLHPVAFSQHPLQLSGIAIHRSHLDTMAVGDAVADTGYAYGIGLGSRMGIKPAFKFRDQLIMVFEPWAESESVATCGIYEHGTVVAGIAHGLIVFQSVGHKRYHVVVTGREDDGRGREVAFHGILRGEIMYHFRVLLVFSQEVTA